MPPKERWIPWTLERCRLILIGLDLVVAVPALAQTPSPFEAAPGPTAPAPHPRVTRPAPEPEIPQPALQPPRASQDWEGTTGIWHVKATIIGQKITGRLECRGLKGNWTGWGPIFEGTVDAAGNVSALTSPWGAWLARKISGTLTHLSIETTEISPNNINCPNGLVELKQIL
jgi:hypothetical protein